MRGLAIVKEAKTMHSSPLTLTYPFPGVAQITVARPRVRNALDWETMEAFAAAVHTLEGAADVRAAVLCGAGGTFLSGGDLRALHGAVTEAEGARLVRVMSDALDALEALPFPVIAALDGAARGGGAEVALACDVRLMAEDATLGFVQISLGLMPGWGGAGRLLRTVGYGRALLWLTTGRILTAEEACRHHLVEQLAPPGGALPAALDLAQRIAERHPPAVRAIKRTLRAHLASASLPEAVAVERAAFLPLWTDEYHLQAVERFLARKRSGA